VRRDKTGLGEPGAVEPVGALECALVAAAPAGRIPCAAIFRIAAEQGVAAAEAGLAVQRLRLKVIGCQVGCF
jgi:hypothetical protein